MDQNHETQRLDYNVIVRGRVKNGKVLLDDPLALPEGSEVEVRPAVKPEVAKARLPIDRPRRKSLAERLANVRGTAKGLPPDASVNHDHYLYGTPRRD